MKMKEFEPRERCHYSSHGGRGAYIPLDIYISYLQKGPRTRHIPGRDQK